MLGRKGTPGKYFATRRSAGPIIFASSGGGTAIGRRRPTIVTVTLGSAIARMSAALVVSASSPGTIRQLIVALARCGKALGACPPSNIVATQVVRNIELKVRSVETMASALLSLGSLESR